MNTGIWTIYNGRRYRSRLEARWAAFFDRLGWPYEYEPIDLDGYIPDFVMTFKSPLLVEVKPEFSVEGLRQHRQRIEASGWQHEALLVGATFFPAGHVGEPAIGLLAERFVGFGEPTPWPEADWEGAATMFCEQHKGPGLHHQVQSYTCRVCGGGDGDHHLGDAGSLFEDAWAAAGNDVQWRRGD
jgi:hypothetical protein